MRILTGASNIMSSITVSRTDRQAIIKYILEGKNRERLTYGVSYDDGVVPIFIIGVDKTDIPALPYPYVIESNNTKYIVSNLVGMIKSTMIDDSLIASRKSDAVYFELMRSILTFKTLTDETPSVLVTITAQVLTIWIREELKRKYKLDVIDTADVEGAVFYYLLKQFDPDMDMSTVKTKMSNYLSGAYRGSGSNIDRVIDRLKDVEGNISTYISALSDSVTLQNLDMRAILSSVDSGWYSGGMSSNLQIYAMIEDFHTAAAIIYHTLNTPTGKKTKLAGLLDNQKRIVKIDQLENIFDKMMNEYVGK